MTKINMTMATGTAHTAGLRPFLLPVCFAAVGGMGGRTVVPAGAGVGAGAGSVGKKTHGYVKRRNIIIENV